MTEALTAARALQDAAVWLQSAEKLWNSDNDRVQARAAADIAQAYSAYVLTYTMRNDFIDVRSTAGGI